MKKIISFLLIASFILSSSLSVFAINTTALSSGISENFDLIETVNEIVTSENNMNATSSSNTAITIITDTPQLQEVKITEGTKTNVLTYDMVNQKIYVDGSLVIITDVAGPIANENIEVMTLGSPFDNSYKKVSYGKQIIDLTVTAMGAIITAACYMTSTGGASLARKIINAAAQTSYLYCDATYCHSYKRLDDSYNFYNNYWDMYWNSSYSNFCASYSQAIYQ